MRLGKRIAWDADHLKVPGVPEADAVINEPRRKGWELACEAIPVLAAG